MEISVIRNNKKVYSYEPVYITDEVLNDLVKTNADLKGKDIKKALQILLLATMLSTVGGITFGVYSNINIAIKAVLGI